MSFMSRYFGTCSYYHLLIQSIRIIDTEKDSMKKVVSHTFIQFALFTIKKINFQIYEILHHLIIGSKTKLPFMEWVDASVSN